MKDLDKVFKKNTELAWRIIDNETMIIPLDEQTVDTEKIEVLNPTATCIWELINGENTLKEIIEKICEEYEIEYEEAEKEVLGFIRDLRNKNLITLGGER
ncbi:MAG: PqqD family protein [Candidatus Omnitrophica bacterium]|nr:PqqD family protein [Candidatus Omnitrophota bacterium]